jgi:flagellar biosynthetic protein FliQ
VSAEQAVELLAGVLRAAMAIGGPVLAACLTAGLIVGIIQTATQVNEASVSYVVKVIALVGVVATVGPMMAQGAIAYTRTTWQAIEHVVK